MSVLKGIFVYTLIFIGLVIGVGVILVGIMYFFPSVSIFGYKFYHGNDAGATYDVVSKLDTTETTVDNNIINIDKSITDNLDAVEIIADEYNIEVAIFKGTLADTNFRVEFTRSLTGFINKESEGPKFSVSASQKALSGETTNKNVVTFAVSEPDGLYMNRNAHITVWISDTIAGGNLKDLRIESGRGHVDFRQGFVSELDTSGNPTLNVDNLSIVDNSNTVNLKYVNIKKSLRIDADSSDFVYEDDLACDVTLKVKKGKFKFADINKRSADDRPEVIVDAVNADVQFGVVDAETVRLTSDYGLFRVETIKGDFTSLSHAITDSNNACDLQIGTIEGCVTIQNDSGKIVIDQVGLVNKTYGRTDLNIDTKSGNVTIKNCFAKSADITSTRGAIKLGNALFGGKITTTYGSVTVDFMKEDATIEGVSSSDISDAVANLKEKALSISTGVEKGDGSITVNNVRGNVTLKSGGSGNINATFSDVTGANVLESTRGSVDVVVPQVIHTDITGGQCTGMWLSWEAKNADVHIVNYSSTKNKSTAAEKYNKTYDAVYVGGEFEDTSNPTKMKIKANNRASVYDVGHKNMAA